MDKHPEIRETDFATFFQAANDAKPFLWQQRLAVLACQGHWPRYIQLPTASGKTSCLDIAVFALAYQASRRHRTNQTIDAPRRIFFVVDRRIIVSEASIRAKRLANLLQKALDPTYSLSAPDENLFRNLEPQARESLAKVAWWLRDLAGNQHAPPLDCAELRGGIYRDDAWVRSLLQPTIVTCTVDQIGSRLLFRGYGVSDRNLPIHAALTANDSLILLDEAHCSNPFSQTMASIARYRDANETTRMTARWAEQPPNTPFQFLEMTATPPSHVADSDVFRLDQDDYATDDVLDRRHGCAKPIRLVTSNAKGGKQNQLLAKHVVDQAISLAKGTDNQAPCKRIAIVVNRVDCARQAFELLQSSGVAGPGRVDLMIGRMRPIDRDRLASKLQEYFRSGSDTDLAEPHFVVATQCLEVGADLDFDGMVSQCASLDALRQRFGRLNRLGNSAYARGVIVMAEGDKSPRKPDPIYAESLPETWQWLNEQARDERVDFGIRSLDERMATSRYKQPDGLKKLYPPPQNAPVLMPAHLDLLCQTAPRPALEPEIAPYLHGPNRGVPEVRVCWRADLPEQRDRLDRQWLTRCAKTLAVCPPSSAECLTVPLPLMKSWLLGIDADRGDDTTDVLGEILPDQPESTSNKLNGARFPVHRRGVIWTGKECRMVSGHDEELGVLFPQALIVLPVTAGGWSVLGHLPDAPREPEYSATNSPSDLAEVERQQLARVDKATAAFLQARNRLILRVHRGLPTSSSDRTALQGLWDYLDDKELPWRHLTLGREIDSSAEYPFNAIELPAQTRCDELTAIRSDLAKTPARQVCMVRYPDGFAVVGPRMAQREQLPRASFDDELDEHNLDLAERVTLADHLADVAEETRRLVAGIELSTPLGQALVAAAERHDLGKADLRFQAMLLGSSLDLAAMQPTLWAKSARGEASRAVLVDSDLAAATADRLPRGFRHEMLSLQLAQQIQDDLEDDDTRNLMLHAIAAHHGHARPLAPVVFDDSPTDVRLGLPTPDGIQDMEVHLSSEDRSACSAHRLDSGISARFWELNYRFGWWGLAWLETILRLADWVASEQPQRRQEKITWQAMSATSSQVSVTPPLRLNCAGLNGSNPLGFLAALGLFRLLATALDSSTKMFWEISQGSWSPTFVGKNPVLASEESLLEWLTKSLQIDPQQHPLKLLCELPEESLNLTRPSEYSMAVERATFRDRQWCDWLSCNGSDLCEASSNSQLQTARRDYFPESVSAVIAATTSSHLQRALFRTWDYADPIQKVSLHLEPREDRRHAYQWFKPVADPTRTVQGGMVGANRLAIEAWPLMQSLPFRGELQTIGFQGTRPAKGIHWTWPLWQVPLELSGVMTALNLGELQINTEGAAAIDRDELLARGICLVFRLRRILVEKTPNFTLPIALMAARQLPDSANLTAK